MTQPKHTHPLGYVQHTAKQLKDYWFLILLAVWQWDHLTTTWRVVAVLAVVTWLLIWPLLKWLTLTYQLTATAIVVNSGIFVRHHRHIPYSRLQTVQRKQWFYLRPFHLETLQIETASHQDGEPEVQLPAVPLNRQRPRRQPITTSVPCSSAT
ncbi:PH domain-containing protein [Levilactobacillus spicheri]